MMHTLVEIFACCRIFIFQKRVSFTQQLVVYFRETKDCTYILHVEMYMIRTIGFSAEDHKLGR